MSSPHHSWQGRQFDTLPTCRSKYLYLFPVICICFFNKQIIIFLRNFMDWGRWSSRIWYLQRVQITMYSMRRKMYLNRFEECWRKSTARNIGARGRIILSMPPWNTSWSLSWKKSSSRLQEAYGPLYLLLRRPLLRSSCPFFCFFFFFFFFFFFVFSTNCNFLITLSLELQGSGAMVSKDKTERVDASTVIKKD